MDCHQLQPAISSTISDDEIMKAAVSFSGFKLYTILQHYFHVEGHHPQEGGWRVAHQGPPWRRAWSGHNYGVLYTLCVYRPIGLHGQDTCTQFVNVLDPLLLDLLLHYGPHFIVDLNPMCLVAKA